MTTRKPLAGEGMEWSQVRQTAGDGQVSPVQLWPKAGIWHLAFADWIEGEGRQERKIPPLCKYR